MLILRWS